MYDTYEQIAVTAHDDGVVLAELNRPERLNAITFAMFDEFTRLQQEVDTDPRARVLVITGSGRAFCAGLDLDEAALLPDMPPLKMLEEQTGWGRSIAGFRTMRTPVVAAVNGAAAGAGMALALAADIRLASPEARFNAAFVKIGLSGGDVGTSWMLPRIVGLGRAYEILMTGRFVGADEALHIGMVTEVAPAESLRERALETARVLCANSPVGMELTKQVVQQNVDAPSLEAALTLENRNQVLSSHTADMVEALTAFREKRAPIFRGE